MFILIKVKNRKAAIITSSIGKINAFGQNNIDSQQAVPAICNNFMFN